MLLVSILKGLVAAIALAFLAVSGFFAVSFGLAYAATGNVQDAAKVNYGMAKYGGTGVGLGWTGVPVAIDGARDGSVAMKKQACADNFSGSVCQSYMKSELHLKTGTAGQNQLTPVPKSKSGKN